MPSFRPCVPSGKIIIQVLGKIPTFSNSVFPYVHLSSSIRSDQISFPLLTTHLRLSVVLLRITFFHLTTTNPIVSSLFPRYEEPISSCRPLCRYYTRYSSCSSEQAWRLGQQWRPEQQLGQLASRPARQRLGQGRLWQPRWMGQWWLRKPRWMGRSRLWQPRWMGRPRRLWQPWRMGSSYPDLRLDYHHLHALDLDIPGLSHLDFSSLSCLADLASLPDLDFGHDLRGIDRDHHSECH